MKEKMTINLDNKIIVLSFEEFDTDIDVDELTRIDYSNLFGEMVTVSTLLNRVGLLKADFEARVSHSKMEFDIYCAGLRKMYRSNAIKSSSKLTAQEVEDMVLMDEGYKIRKSNTFQHTKQLQYLDSIYWSVKSKDDKLSVLLKGVTPIEFETGIAEGVVNGIMINKKEKLIK